MATVTGMTAEHTQALTDEAFVGATIDSAGAFTLTKQNGVVVNPGTIPTDDSIIDLVYPVGSIYLTTDSVNPATKFGFGTWVAWGSGRVPVGVDVNDPQFSTVEETGGEKNHVLTVGELAEHNHGINHDHGTFKTASGGAHDHPITSDGSVGTTTGVFARGVTARWSGSGMMDNGYGYHQHDIDVPAYTGVSGSEGVSQAHNNLQPYITCYMWKRTA